MNRLPRLLLYGLACSTVWVGLGATPRAIERKPLPAFTVTTLGGAAVQSAEITQPGKWLFIYVQPQCAQCEALLRALDGAGQPAAVARMAIVVGGLDEAGAARFAETFPNLATATWYVDAGRVAPRLTKAPGLPFAFGMRDAVTTWAQVGAVPDTASAVSALVSWTRQ